MKTPAVFLLSVLGFLFVTSSTVFAYSHYSDKAERWLEQRCSQDRYRGHPIYATLCSFRDKINTLESTAKSTTNRVDTLEATVSSSNSRIDTLAPLTDAVAVLENGVESAIGRIGFLETTVESLRSAIESAVSRINTLEVTTQSSSTQIAALESTSTSMTSRIDALETAVATPPDYGKRILDYAQVRGSLWTTSSTSDTPTPDFVTVSCSQGCVLWVSYDVDTRNTQSSGTPIGYNHLYGIYVDGVNQAVFNQASMSVPNAAVPLAVNGVFPVAAGEHTVAIYARATGGHLEQHESHLQVLAIEQ